MKKTLLCLAIGIGSFYLGNFTQSLFDWEKIEVNFPPEKHIEHFDLAIPEAAPPQEIPNNQYLTIPIEGGGWGYYYNLPSSKGKHAPDFYWDGGFYVRKQPSTTDLQVFVFETVSYDESKFSFVTEEIDGIRYSMQGDMPNEKNGFIIKGTLTKFKAGVSVFKRKVVFREAIPDC